MVDGYEALYRREVRLVSRRLALLLMALRLAAVAVIFLTLAADPALVAVTSKEVPGRVLIGGPESARFTELPLPQA